MLPHARERLIQSGFRSAVKGQMPLFPYLPAIVWVGMIKVMLDMTHDDDALGINVSTGLSANSASIVPFPNSPCGSSPLIETPSGWRPASGRKHMSSKVKDSNYVAHHVTVAISSRESEIRQRKLRQLAILGCAVGFLLAAALILL